MNDAENPWIELNQRLIALELQRLKRRLRREDTQALDRQITEATTSPSALDLLVDAFGLTPFERSLLLLCAGVEFDSEIASACSAASSRSGASFSLALATLNEPHWSALTPARPLRRWRMIESEPGSLLATATLRIDERILHFLAGINLLDARLESLLTIPTAPKTSPQAQRVLAERLARDWKSLEGRQAIVHLSGDDAAGAEDVAASAAETLGLRLYVVQSEHLPASMPDLNAFAVLWDREAALLPAALLVQCGDAAAPATVNALAERLSASLIVSARAPQRLRRATHAYEVRKPNATEQKHLWRIALGANGHDDPALDSALDSVTTQFRLSAQAIAFAGRAVTTRIAAGEPAVDALWSICRGTGRSGLDELATRIVPEAGWDDLVLPEPQLVTLKHIAAQVRQRRRVHDDWGFGQRCERGLGVSVLFSGESGTGKTSGGGGAGLGSQPRSLPDRSVVSRQQVHRRDGKKPASRVRRRRGQRRHPSV